MVSEYMKTIYYNVLSEEKKGGLSQICQRLGIELVPIGSDCLNIRLIDLIARRFGELNSKMGNKEKANGAVQAPLLYNLPEFIIFNGFDDSSLEEFLTAYKFTGLPRVQLKAVVTPYNITWTLYELLEHLKEESMRR